MRISAKQKDILKAIGQVALLASAAILVPNILQLLKPKTSQQKYQYSRSLKRLVRNDIIYLFGEEIRLTKKGRELFKLVEIDEITIPKYDNWDGIWHLVCYDIPEKKKKERDHLQQKLLHSGFWAVQDSLWVYPWDCKQEIAVICQNLGVSPYVAYLNTDYLPRQDKIIKRFNLNNNIVE